MEPDRDDDALLVAAADDPEAFAAFYYEPDHRADALGVASCLHMGSDRVAPMDAKARALADRADVAVFVGADRAR